jgi:hypothetical protein
MLLRLARAVAPAVLVAFAFSTPAHAQGKGGNNGNNGQNQQNIPKMPTQDEIESAAKQLLGACETQTADLDGFAKLTYKAIPTSQDEILKLVGQKYKDKIGNNKNIDVDGLLNQFGPQIQEAMNKYLTEPEGWKFEALEDLKWKSWKIKKGEYKVSLEVDGEQLKALTLSQPETTDEKGKKVKAVSIPIRFKQVKKQNDPFGKLKFEFKGIEDKKTQKTLSFDVLSEFFRTQSKANDPIKLDPPKDAPKKDDAKKDDAPKADPPKDDKKPE